MKKQLIILASTAMLLMACNQQASQQDKAEVKLDSDTEKLSYAMGLDIGQTLKRLEMDIDLDVFQAGMKATLEGTKPLLGPQEAAQAKQAFFQKKQQEQTAKRDAKGAENKKAGEAFLAENKTKEGVKVTSSGLQYLVLKKGDGPKPQATDTVKVHYKGTLIDGTEFDSSYKRGEPVSFPLSRVIKGWTEGLQLMSVNSKYRLFVPSGLGYGESGAGPKIGPNAALIFDVELLEIVKQ